MYSRRRVTSFCTYRYPSCGSAAHPQARLSHPRIDTYGDLSLRSTPSSYPLDLSEQFNSSAPDA
eukprot:scaffold135452_cov32-Tisochrysis_lutea.AAC.6